MERRRKRILCAASTDASTTTATAAAGQLIRALSSEVIDVIIPLYKAYILILSYINFT